MSIVVLLHLGIAYWLYRFFVSRDRGAKEPISALRIACIFGVAAGFMAGELNNALLPDALLTYLEGGPDPGHATVLFGALMVGVIEESVKFIPLALFIYKKRYFNEVTDGIVYFGLCGMWFGALESISYALIYDQSVGLMRLIVVPFLHAAFAALVGWGLAQYKVRKASIVVPIGLFLGAIVAHGLYDYLLFASVAVFAFIALIFAVLINLSIFAIYRKAQEADEALGLSAVGKNDFCRHCGAQNRGNNLFCVACGQKA